MGIFELGSLVALLVGCMFIASARAEYRRGRKVISLSLGVCGIITFIFSVAVFLRAMGH